MRKYRTFRLSHSLFLIPDFYMPLPQINRKINLLQATSINMIDMVGIGPFLVMPFVVAQFNNGLFIWAWIFGAFTAFEVVIICSELAAKFQLPAAPSNFILLAYV